MGKYYKIEWTDYTFNPWIGCSKVSCYAEAMVKPRPTLAQQQTAPAEVQR